MPTDDSLDRLSFGLRSVSFNRIVALCVAFGFAGAAVFLAGLLVLELLSSRTADISWGYIAGLAIAVMMAIGIAYMASQVRSFSVHNGWMALPLPLRLKSDKRVKSIPLREIRTARPWMNSDGKTGFEFQLVDETVFYVLLEDLPQGAGEFLSRLAAAVSRDNAPRR